MATLAFFAPGLQAAELNVPHSFTAGTPAVAAQVNGNSDAVETVVDDNDACPNVLRGTPATAAMPRQADVHERQAGWRRWRTRGRNAENWP